MKIDLALRSAYLGHNKLFFVGNNQKNGFQGKIEEVVNTVFSILGFPTSLGRYRKFLVNTANIDFSGRQKDYENWGQTPSYEDYHGKIF